MTTSLWIPMEDVCVSISILVVATRCRMEENVIADITCACERAATPLILSPSTLQRTKERLLDYLTESIELQQKVFLWPT